MALCFRLSGPGLASQASFQLFESGGNEFPEGPIPGPGSDSQGGGHGRSRSGRETILTFVMVEMIQERLAQHLVKFTAETFIVKPDAQLAAEGNQL